MVLVKGSAAAMRRRGFLRLGVHGVGVSALLVRAEGGLLLLGGLLGTGCDNTRSPAKVPLAPPEESTTLGPGDTFMLRVVGDDEKAWGEFTVDSDGTVEFPHVHRVKVAGLEPQELSLLMREQLVKQDFFTDPSVIVRVTAYRSKQISILGQVQRPGSFPFQPGMTFVQGVSQAGGLNAIAKSRQIRLTRRVKGGGTMTVVLDFDAINAGVTEDPPLQAGDRIFVDERVF
jgi:protein involved in polysaccharide export with SLBB domain